MLFCCLTSSFRFFWRAIFILTLLFYWTKLNRQVCMPANKTVTSNLGNNSQLSWRCFLYYLVGFIRNWIDVGVLYFEKENERVPTIQEKWTIKPGLYEWLRWRQSSRKLVVETKRNGIRLGYIDLGETFRITVYWFLFDLSKRKRKILSQWFTKCILVLI